VFFPKGSSYQNPIFSAGRKATQKVIQKQGGRKHVNRYPSGLALLAAAILIGSAPARAHEECDGSEDKISSAAGDESFRPARPDITIKLFQFQPGRVQVKAGTTVTWVNDDEIVHTVTLDAKEKSFDAALDGKGKSFSFTFTKAGIYIYYCDRHEHMRGEIEVR
jgi:plastocyanin